MRDKNLSVLRKDSLTLEKLEARLNKHTTDLVPVDRWTAFSWSASRDAMLERCARQYYLNYYGSRRVREAKDDLVSAVWWLKQISTHDAWIGTVVHEIA